MCEASLTHQNAAVRHPTVPAEQLTLLVKGVQDGAWPPSHLFQPSVVGVCVCVGGDRCTGEAE